jgi:UV DNA damage endonuclease
MSARFGYCCINLELQETEGVTCNKTMRKATFEKKGKEYASELSLKNVKGLERIIDWNIEKGLKVFRMSSTLFPWASEYRWDELQDIEEIRKVMSRTGEKANKAGLRLSFHPGPFNCLTSENPKAVLNCIRDLKMHGDMMDMLEQPRNHWAKINIHIGGAYGDRESALYRWCKNFELLPESVKSRLTVENDDRKNLYSTKMLFDSIYKILQIPIVFDSHHFECGPEDVSYEESLAMAVESWPQGIRPMCHHSNSKKLYEDETVNTYAAHSNYYYKPFKDSGYEVDVAMEAKAKEKALFKYLKDFS